jgi:hypothetical protein
MSESTIKKGDVVNFLLKKVETTGKVVKVYEEKDKTYAKISYKFDETKNKYCFKQTKFLTLI